MSFDSLRWRSYEVVRDTSFSWLTSAPVVGRDELAFVDHDQHCITGMTRADAEAVLLARWPSDENIKRAIFEMNGSPDRKWVVAIEGSAFVWFPASPSISHAAARAVVH